MEATCSISHLPVRGRGGLEGASEALREPRQHGGRARQHDALRQMAVHGGVRGHHRVPHQLVHPHVQPRRPPPGGGVAPRVG
eukprot:1574904-Pyramimonas_sp.AAC.1